MKVDKIQQNYSNLRKTNSQSYSNVSFQRGSMRDQITSSLPAKHVIKWMKSLEWLKGEIGGILITAIGTGTVAPLFIGFNPFVKAPKGATEEQKEDLKNTKQYTAMRQPISAILAILFQVSALGPIDKFLNKIFNNEKYSKHLDIHVDLSEINDKSVVKAAVKKQMKEENIKKTSWTKIFTDGFKAVSKKRDGFDEIFDARVKEIEDKQINKVAKEFQEIGKIKVGDRFLDNKSLAELVNAQIDDYIKDAEWLKHNSRALEFYSERAEVLIKNEEHLREIFKDAPTDPKQLKNFLNKALVAENNNEVRELIQEILNRPEEIQGHRIKRTFERIQQIKDMCPKGEYSFKGYLEAMTRRNGELDEIITKLRLNKIKDVNNATDNKISETIKAIVESCSFKKENKALNSILHDSTTFDPDKAKLTNKIHKDITKQYKEMLKNNYKSVNQIIKIIIGVFITLPITCNALNWVYPRLMDIAFPKLAGKKKSQEAKEVK